MRGKNLLAGLHAVEASYVSSSTGAFRAAFARSVWSSKMPFADTRLLLTHMNQVPHDAQVSGPYRPDEVPRIFRMVYLIAHGADGHGRVHLLLVSAAEIGFVWDGAERGWIRSSLLPFWMLSGPIQHFKSALFDAWQLKVGAQLADSKGFGVGSSWMHEDLHNYFTLPSCGKEIKCC